MCLNWLVWSRNVQYVRTFLNWLLYLHELGTFSQVFRAITKMFKTISNISGSTAILKNCHQNNTPNLLDIDIPQISGTSNSTSESTTCWNRENIIWSRKSFLSVFLLFFLLGFKYLDVPCLVSHEYIVCLPSHDNSDGSFQKNKSKSDYHCFQSKTLGFSMCDPQ